MYANTKNKKYASLNRTIHLSVLACVCERTRV